MSKQLLAFDIGGTTIKYALVDEQLNLSHTGKVATEQNKDGHILNELLDIAAEFQGNYQIDAIGVSTAGIVGADGGILYAGPTIPGYQGTPIQEKLAEETNLPVFVVNDVDAALLGETVDGVAKNVGAAYCVALGTGIGGAYLLDGKLDSGAHSYANSIGYILYDQESKTYFEQRASTLALEDSLKSDGISVIDAFEKAKQNDEHYLAVIENWAYEVARGLAEVVLLFDPEILVIGGAVSQQGEFLLDILRKQMSQLIPKGLFQTELKIAKLTDKAQLYGAISKFV